MRHSAVAGDTQILTCSRQGDLAVPVLLSLSIPLQDERFHPSVFKA